MIKKRAAKRTKTINYRRQIHKSVLTNPGRSKDEICRMIKGSRSIVWVHIINLLDEGILIHAKEGGLIVSPDTHDLTRKHDMLMNQLDNFRETRDNTIDRIKERIEKSPSKSFFSQTEFTYTKPVQIASEVTHTGSSTKVGPDGPVEVETAEIYHINDEAKDWIFLIPHLVDNLIRSAFTLYTSQMLSPISSESYKEIFEVSIKDVLKEIKKTKKLLITMVDKKDKKYFEGWWWQLTVGLELDTEPYPNPKTDVRWTGKKI